MLLIANTHIQKANLYALHILLLLLAFFENLIPISLVIVLVLNLFSVSWKDRVYYWKKRKKAIWSFIAFYGMTLLGVLYSEDLPSALFDLEVKLSMLLLPLFMLTSNFINRYTVIPLIKTFIFGVSVAMAIQLGLATLNYYDTGNLKVYFYTLFSFFHHPSYFSMYTNFSIGSILVLIFHAKNTPQVKHFALLAFLGVGVYLLASRAGLLTFVILMLFSFGWMLFPVLKWRKMFVAMLLTSALVLGAVLAINQFTSFTRKVDASNTNSSAGIRLEMWKASVPLIQENFLFGVGTGDVNRELQMEFAKRGLLRAVRDNLNAHSQIIQTQVALGILGLGSLALGFIYPLLGAIRRRNLFFPMFFVIMGVNFLTESMLNAQAGVIFYALLNVCMYFTYAD